MLSEDINFIYCNFPDTFDTDALYTCTVEERCCDVGCCVYTSYKFHKFWYYWLVLFIVFGIFSTSSWFCKKSALEAPSGGGQSQPQRRIFPESCPSSGDCYPECLNYFTELEDTDSQMILDQLIVSFRSRSSGDSSRRSPPPEYDSLSQKRSKDYVAFYGPPPKYSSIFKFPQQAVFGGNMADGANGNGSGQSAAGETAGNGELACRSRDAFHFDDCSDEDDEPKIS